MTANNNPAEDVEKKPEAVVEGYRKRLTVLRKAQEFSKAEDMPKAVQHYNLYLNALARFYGIKEEELSPKFFDEKRDITELLLISHAYWDLAKAYDRSPKLALESIRCLKQFVKFSSGFKFQHVNAQMLRKFIRKGHAYNPRAFKEAYELIQLKSKGCYVVTFCFGEGSEEVSIARVIRDDIIQFHLGKKLVNNYYHFAPKIIEQTKKSNGLLLCSQLIVKPLLWTIVKLYAHFKKTTPN